MAHGSFPLSYRIGTAIVLFGNEPTSIDNKWSMLIWAVFIELAMSKEFSAWYSNCGRDGMVKYLCFFSNICSSLTNLSISGFSSCLVLLPGNFSVTRGFPSEIPIKPFITLTIFDWIVNEYYYQQSRGFPRAPNDRRLKALCTFANVFLKDITTPINIIKKCNSRREQVSPFALVATFNETK